MLRVKDKQKYSGYELTRAWFDFAFENSYKVTPNHHTLYLWLVEQNNRLRWVPTFGVPRSDTMSRLGIRNHHTYSKVFGDLINWGLIELVQKARNQHTANIISLLPPKQTGKYLINEACHGQFDNTTDECHSQFDHSTDHGTDYSTVYINKQETKETKETNNLRNEGFSLNYKSNNNYDAIAFKLWKQVYENMKDKNISPSNLKKVKVKVWANTVMLMIERDGRSVDEIDEVLKFLQMDDFWGNIIISTSKLREKFEDLQLRTRTKKQSQKKSIASFKESEQNYSISNNEI